ncbi:unnamed protein product [Candidula unifasciata]|uniref:Cilia- and flagella-associated protein 221 n=1 Tax=Candidula unifasciata TaxID=100452 RepID=A0A8S3ZZJ9_9EUPU|nr:unnamed protein product [Candidula unifasciata]
MPTVIEQVDRAVSGALSSHGSGVEREQSATTDEALMIEQMQLTEPMKSQHAPNHLLETKTFATVGCNLVVHAKPKVVYFEGFQVGEKQVKNLRLQNASSEVLRIHIIPPQTRHFGLKYTKPARMIPGMAVECQVEFTPDEWRYYYDCIRIHCPGEDNLIVPIHGYPVMSTKDFPKNYTFQPVAVGYSVSKTFPLKSMAPVDFEFRFEYIKSHPAFSLEPMSGIVSANSLVEVTVTFAPSEFQTASMTVQLSISQFNSKGIVCTFTGTSKPGLLKEDTLLAVDSDVLDPKCVSPLDRARRNKQQTKTVRIIQKRKSVSSSGQMVTLERDGIRLPSKLDNPHAVSRILLHEPGKMRATEMRQNMLSGDLMSSETTQQVKEAMFEEAVRQNVYEERQNQLRWQVKIGDEPMSAQERYTILEARNEAFNRYKLRRGDPVPEDELTRQQTISVYSKTMRDADLLAPADAMFDLYANDVWNTRQAALDRFVQAARTVIVRNRVSKRLPGLRKLTADLNARKHTGTSEDGSEETPEDSESVNLGTRLSMFTADKVQKSMFPVYVSPSIKDDMAPDALGTVPVIPTEVVIKRDVPFLNLKVPQYYKLQCYQKHSIHVSFLDDMPLKKVPSLRTGAEDEIIKVSDDGDFCKCPEPDEAAVLPATSAALSLKPPSAFFKPIEYPSLQIMNPAPGLQTFLPLLPYSEVDADYHLCPLPRQYTLDQTFNKPAPTQKKFLHREETIRGVMTWKRFPSPGIISMSNIPTLTNVWVPRWSNCFGKDILPEDVPPLLGRIDPEDAENCVDSDEETPLGLTPEMITAQFPMIGSNLQSDKRSVIDNFPLGNKLPKCNAPVGINGPLAREIREEELEHFVTSKYNTLGTKVARRVLEQNVKFTDRDLILK